MEQSQNKAFEKLIVDIINKTIYEYEKKKAIETKNKVLHNVKILLKHYPDLKAHAENAITDIQECIEFNNSSYLNFEEIDEIYIENLKRSRGKTIIMINHIDSCLEILKSKCKKEYKGTRKYKAFESYYLEGKKMEDIGEELKTTKQNVSKWIKSLEESLSSIMFGVDGVLK